MKLRSRLYISSLRWLALLAVLVFAAWACVSHPLAQPTPDPVQETHGQIVVAPLRQLDLLFMIDNSGSMKPKQDKMRAQFPTLIEALRDPRDQSLPDLRIAIIDSDLGAGRSASCPKSDRYGDVGRFQMRNAAECGANPDARWLELTKGNAINFKGELKDVFGCLASAVGVAGCGLEHQLGAIDWAFWLSDNASQKEFLRDQAYLGIVILTDEDDCSATPESTLFAAKHLGESGSLRCSTQGHVCEGVTLPMPATAPLSVPYESCHARTDRTCEDGKDDSNCNPLLDVKKLASNLKALKSKDVDEKLLVAAIYGRPRQGETAEKKYVIDKVVESGVELWGYRPICYDPDYMPSGSGYDQTAADHGAAGGLRISAFLNEFKKENALGYSICESDFGPAMEGIGERLRKMMYNLCVPFKVVDTSDTPGVQADCRVAYKRRVKKVGADGQTTVAFEEDKDPIPACDDSHTPPCWELKLGNANGSADEQETARRCPATAATLSQWINIVRKPGDELEDGTQAVMYCLSCVEALPGMPPKKGCDY